MAVLCSLASPAHAETEFKYIDKTIKQLLDTGASIAQIEGPHIYLHRVSMMSEGKLQKNAIFRCHLNRTVIKDCQQAIDQ